ncbi:MAG: purine-nucleoside phosphorylase [Campylobacter sp.]|nr:purine-nucleoside phosphorylase [Campylobacter sp.]
MIVCAGRSEIFDFATPIGVGLVDSAINLTTLLLDKKPKNILFVGTTGLYRDGEILGIYESSSAVQHEISEINSQSYSPIFSDLICNVSRETLVVNSSNFITTDEISVAKFAKLGYFMENMEFYSVVQVAKKFEIPCLGLFCATNFCNSLAHDDFIKNHQVAKEKLEIHTKKRGYLEKFL